MSGGLNNFDRAAMTEKTRSVSKRILNRIGVDRD
jgi:hypothetical protein